MDATKDPLALAGFSYGAEHIDPVRAADAGLIYETVAEDYVKMLGSVGYKPAKLGKIFGGKRSCLTRGRITPKDLNYPSMTACIKANVEPSILAFEAMNEKKSFKVVISGKTKEKMVSASLEWSDGIHRVRSPVVPYRDDL
ncbi:hypothetical protein SASPL_107728 [Salvia splendens]|uniref:Subtilisin-like protease fibronectin type-III domain-containing protein n=1 Tax=Salvia splendens TaxID=180675 RepID=A0A8X8YGX9_SALSN|nr:hypothetical protein SASPL_107728 [Salvia splendens]